MQRRGLDRFFLEARNYVKRTSPEEIQWAQEQSPEKFRRIRAKQFLGEYAWVVYVAGFRESVIRKKFPAIARAFRNFDLKKLSRMRSIRPVLAVFGNRTRARCVLRGARMIQDEGFANFKKRVGMEGAIALTQLPGIGLITKDHLARNVGLASVAKNDLWIQRLVGVFNASSHEDMVAYLSRKHRLKPGTVDLILWRFCADNGWKRLGYPNFSSFVGRVR